MTGKGVTRVVPITFGWEDLPKSVSVYGADPNVRLKEPVPGVLLELDGGWMLLDTGFNDPIVKDPFFYRRFHNNGVEAIPVSRDRDSLEVAFETVGIDPADVAVVALSHLHNDHSGGVRWFAERVPIHAQRKELEYGLGCDPDPHPEREAMYRIDYDDPAIDWRVADGDTEIAPGVTAIATYGHTPGHQSFMVQLAEPLAEEIGVPGFVFAFDAADLQENIDDELPVGGAIGAHPSVTLEPILRLKALASERGYRLLPGHDPVVWPAFTAEMGVAGPGA